MVNDHIFVFGGRGVGTSGLLTSVEEHDPTTGKWTITAGGQHALPELMHMGVGVVDDVIYAIDGSDGYLDGQTPPVRQLRVSNRVYGLAVVESAKSFVSTGNKDPLLSRAGVGVAVAVGKCYWSARRPFLCGSAEPANAAPPRCEKDACCCDKFCNKKRSACCPNEPALG